MRVSDHNKTVVDIITCVYDSFNMQMSDVIIEKSIFHHISANIAHNSIHKESRPMSLGSTIVKGPLLK